MSRTVTRLRDDWKFTRTEQADALATTCDDSGWETVQVPHDWAIAGPFDREHDMVTRAQKDQADIEEGTIQITGRTGGLPHIGEGWYRKRIDIPASSAGKRFRIECDGIMSRSRIYCNGEFAGTWPYGYSSFAFDLTDFITPGEANLIAVHVNNPGSSSRWYPGAGIYRNVRLVELDPVHIDHWGVEITTPEVRDTHGTVQIKTRLVNAAQADDVTVKTTILDPDGSPVLTEVEPVTDAVAEQTLVVEAPTRWSLENPAQYTVQSEVLVNGSATDALETRFGFRTVRFDVGKGMFLNDQPVKMHGVCMHHDLGPLGAAVNREALKRQLTLLQEMGCNAIRTSHNPPDPQLPKLASEMGVLIIDEMFDEWKHSKMDNGYNTLWDEWAEKDVRALIKRDRNHPAVIMWSIGNEISEQWQEDGTEIAQFLVDTCHDEDPTRPTTAGLNRAVGALNKVAGVLDIPGWNYQPHDYVHARTLYPDLPMYGAETASTVSSRGEYYFPAVDEIHLRRDTLQVNSYDLSCPSWATAPDTEFRAQDMCDFIMGEFVWTGFDYLGEPTPYNEEWPSRSSYFGIIDLGGLPKNRFYLYQSQWSAKDMIHLMPHWTWPGHEGQPVPVQCYTSYDNAELFVNGKSQGKQSHYQKYKVFASNYRFQWPAVAYEPGEIKVVAYDKEGNVAAETSVVTAGEPAAIELVSDRPSVKTDGDDMAFVTVRIVDKDGNLCPRADSSLSYAIDGPGTIAGLCNGNAASLESFKGTRMKAYNGLCVLYLGTVDGQAGDVTVTVSAESLTANTLKLKTDRS